MQRNPLPLIGRMRKLIAQHKRGNGVNAIYAVNQRQRRNTQHKKDDAEKSAAKQTARQIFSDGIFCLSHNTDPPLFAALNR